VSGPPETRLGGIFAPDERWMGEALRLAREAAARGEVPVGALVVRDGVVLARGHNQVEALRDATAHAEILAIGAAGSARGEVEQADDGDDGDDGDAAGSAARGGDWRLDDATLYVTLEPCTMCCGAILLARVGRVVFGAADPRAGAVVSTARLLDGNPYRHRVEVVGGILAGPCGELLRGFFRDRRGAAEAD
jgi:tRNA(adenine34) deaminase